MIKEAIDEVSCLDRLRREAFNCLETFPSKIVQLNEIINEYIPESVRSNRSNCSNVGRKAKCLSTVSTVRNYDLTSASEFDVASYYSHSMYDRSRSRHGICKRRYYRMRGTTGSIVRRRPGPLGQLLAFIVSRLMVCTKKIVIAPSQFIVDGIISMFFQRREYKSVQCGPSIDWDSSLSTCVTTFKKDNTAIGNVIDILRPATVQLISHTTTLKRWLQAAALNATASPTVELANATRTTETIDCWAYEIFFYLKYLQVNRVQRTTDRVTDSDENSKDDMTLVNLWHRLVQLRDNYIILYETLQNYEKISDLDSTKEE